MSEAGRFIWSIWSISFVLLPDPEKPNNQINKTDQGEPIEQTAGRFSHNRLAGNRIEESRLLHLGEISSDSRLASVLKIHDENACRSGIKCFIGKQCGNA